MALVPQAFTVRDFYPRPPGGGRLPGVAVKIPDTQFLSTPSGWRATAISRSPSYPLLISIHALRVEGDSMCEKIIAACGKISIHALRVEGDSKNGQSFRLFLRKREKNLPL